MSQRQRYSDLKETFSERRRYEKLSPQRPKDSSPDVIKGNLPSWAQNEWLELHVQKNRRRSATGLPHMQKMRQHQMRPELLISDPRIRAKREQEREERLRMEKLEDENRRAAELKNARNRATARKERLRRTARRPPPPHKS